ncbi:MAG: integron integrase [Acidobacteriota bacterium]|nr:integron integrase [Acidobacteriota bacterium]
MENFLIDVVRRAVRGRGLSRKTENAYVNHTRQFLKFIGRCDAESAGVSEMGAFLKYLEKDKHFAAATENQVLCALAFFYREAFGRDILPCLKNIKRTRTNDEKPPVILTSAEVRAVLSQLHGAPFLVAALMYGSGLRLNEALNLRVGDVNFRRREIFVREIRTGTKDHRTILPEIIIARLEKHLRQVKFLHEDDCLRGFGKMVLPPVLAQISPEADSQWCWQYVFPAAKLSPNEKRTSFYRRHLAASTVQKAVGEAIERAKVVKKAGCQTLRHSFAVRIFEKTRDIYAVSNLLGHKNLRATLVYTNAVKRATGFSSPLDMV